MNKFEKAVKELQSINTYNMEEAFKQISKILDKFEIDSNEYRVDYNSITRELILVFLDHIDSIGINIKL